MACSNDATGDFSSIGDEDFVDSCYDGSHSVCGNEGLERERVGVGVEEEEI